MPRFTYTGLDHNRQSVKGVVSAENAYAARKQLRAKGIHPTGMKEATNEQIKASGSSFFGNRDKKHVPEFTKQLATMLNAGIKLTEALAVLVQQLPQGDLQNAVQDIRDKVVTGEGFADSLEQYTQFFDIVYISMIRVGEVTGTLGPTLKRLADFAEKRKNVEGKFKTAMMYPAFLFLVCIFAVGFLTIAVLPEIAKQMEQAGATLPWITRMLMAISEAFRSPWVLLIITATMVFVWGLKRLLRTNRGAHIKDKLMLALPVFGSLLKQRIVARFASTLSTLLQSGLSMAESLKVVSQVTGNTVMQDAVKQARERIMSGSDISTPLRDSGVIDPSIAHMVTVGERSGELEEMLSTISHNLEESTEVVVERLSAAFEPVIIVFMTLVVGVIVYATLVPIMQLSAGSF